MEPQPVGLPATITSVLSQFCSSCFNCFSLFPLQPGSGKGLKRQGLVQMRLPHSLAQQPQTHIEEEEQEVGALGTPQERSQRADRHLNIITLWDLLATKGQNQFRVVWQMLPGHVNTSAPYGQLCQRSLNALERSAGDSRPY